MSDFGNGNAPSELAMLRGTVNALQNELIARAQPTLGEITDALNAFSRAAEAGSPQAKQVLKNFLDSIDKARDAAGRITIVRGSG